MRCLFTLVAATSLLVASGCQGTFRFLSRCSQDLADSARQRQELREELAQVKQKEREVCRQETAAELRRELEEIKRQQGPTVAELSANLNQPLKQKIVQSRMVVDREAMSKRTEMLRKLEEEQERMYERALEDHLRRQAEFNRKEYEYSCMCARKMAGDQNCRELPPRPAPFKELPPTRPQPLNVGNEVIYKMELAVATELGAANIENAQARQAPLKERCAPPKPGCCAKCGYNECACERPNGGVANLYYDQDLSPQRRAELLNPDLPRAPPKADDDEQPSDEPSSHRRVGHNVQLHDGEPQLIPAANPAMQAPYLPPQMQPVGVPQLPQQLPQLPANTPRPLNPIRSWR